MAAGGGGTSQIPSGFTYLGQFLDHDLTFDKTTVMLGTTISPTASAPGALAEPRPRLALRRRPAGPRVGQVLRVRRHAPEGRQDGRRRRHPGQARLRPAARRRLERGRQAQGDHPRPSQRREPRRRADPRGDDPLPQSRARQPARRAPRSPAFRPGARAGHQALPVDGPHRLPAADLPAQRGRQRLQPGPQGVRGRRDPDRRADDADRVLGRRLPARPLDDPRRLQLEQDLRQRLRHARLPVHLLGARRQPRRWPAAPEQLDRRLAAPLRLRRVRPREPDRAGRQVQPREGDRHPPRRPARQPAGRRRSAAPGSRSTTRAATSPSAT